MDASTNSTSAPIVSIGGAEIRPLAYKGARVITTELLAREFRATEKNLHDNFGNHQTRFADGVHFFRVSGEELRALKNSPDFIGVVKANTPSLILWTERGVFRHAKILETDQAWEAYERLEDVYFAVKEATAPVPTTAEAFAQAFRMLADAEQRDAQREQRLNLIDARVEKVETAQTVLSARPANSESIVHLRKRIGKMFGLSAETIDTVMRQSPYAPKPAGMVRNEHAEADGATYAVYWMKDITATFERFVDESRQVSPKYWTHPYIEGKFQRVKRAEPSFFG